MGVSITCECGARFELESHFSGQPMNCPECQQPIESDSSIPLSPRTSYCAILALILSLAGAPTLIGSVAGIIFGWFAWKNIRNAPSQLTGRGLALTGIMMGILGLTICTSFYSGLINIKLIQDLLVTSVKADPEGNLEHVDAVNKFSMTRPNRHWGVVDRESDADPILSALLEENTALLLGHIEKPVFIDVNYDSNQFRTLEECATQIIEDFSFGNKPTDIFNQAPNNLNLDREHFFVRSLIQMPAKINLAPLNGVNGMELVFTTRFALHNWPFRIRLYKKGDHLTVVRAFARNQKDMEAVKTDVDQILDSFRIQP